MSELGAVERKTVLFLDDEDYLVPALVHALGVKYRDAVLPRSYTRLGDLLRDGRQLSRVDAVCLDVSAQSHGTEHDFEFGARAYQECFRQLWHSDPRCARRAMFLSRWWPARINEALGVDGDANPFRLGSGIVLTKPVASSRLLEALAGILGTRWTRYDVEPEVSVCGMSQAEPFLYAFNRAVEMQGRDEGSYRYTYFTIQDEDAYVALRPELAPLQVLVVDATLLPHSKILERAREGIRPRVVVATARHGGERGPGQLSEAVAADYGKIWMLECGIRAANNPGQYVVDMPSGWLRRVVADE